MKISSFTEMNSIDYYNNQNKSVTNTDSESYSFIVSDYQDIISNKIESFLSNNIRVKTYKEIKNFDHFIIFLRKYRSYINNENKENIIFKSLSWDSDLRIIFLKEIHYLSKIDMRYNDHKYIFSITNKDIFLDKCDDKFQEYLKKRSKEILSQTTFSIRSQNKS